MKVLSRGAIKLSHPGIHIYFNPGFSTATIKPIGDICACGFDKRVGERVGDVLLDDGCEVIDFPKEDHPAVVGSVMMQYFLHSIVSLLGRSHWYELFEHEVKLYYHCF